MRYCCKDGFLFNRKGLDKGAWHIVNEKNDNHKLCGRKRKMPLWAGVVDVPERGTICKACLAIAAKKGIIFEKEIVAPRDKYSSGHNDCLCYARLYGKTKEEVLVKAEAYFRKYHPDGYGTYFKNFVKKNWEEEYWWCHICRRHSCD